MQPVLLDFETRSRVPLGDLTPRQYWAHPTTQALCCAWYDTASGEVGVWTPGERWPHDGRVLGAHNWEGFDRFGAARMGWRVDGRGIDTSNQARKAGLPGALDALGQRWLGIPKDDEGSRFTKSLSSVRCPPRPLGVPAKDWRAWWSSLDRIDKRAHGVQPELTAEGFVRVIDYCCLDVVIMGEAWPRLSEWIEVDADVEAVDYVINDRGVLFDIELATRLLQLDAELGERVCADVGQRLGMSAAEVCAAANSTQQFCALTGAPNAQALTVADLDHPLADARRALASIARGKLQAGLRLANSDDRLRDGHRYYGAHTGRWSQTGMQQHNMPRPAKWLEDADPDIVGAQVLDGTSLDAIAASYAGAPDAITAAGDIVSFLVRGTLTAPPGKVLAAADFSQVEGRGSAWIAGDDSAVRVYTSGADPYRVAAEAIRSVCKLPATVKPRQIGKCAELACGYGGGPGAFEGIARQNRVDLSELSGDDRRRIVDAWRGLHAPIVRFWYAAEGAFRRAFDGRSAWVKCFQFVPSANGRDVAAFLPSGRPIVYNDVRLSPSSRGKPRITYLPAGEDEKRAAPYCPVCMMRLAKDRYCECGAALSTQGRCKVHGDVAPLRRCPTHGLVPAELRADVYGGKLVENLISAYCRDLMADALIRAERNGLRPVLTVHDEIVCEVDDCAGVEALAELKRTMTTVPAWAAGFPIGANGWVGKRYRK
jgi:DNA polymerase